MGKKEKLIERFTRKPADFRWQELLTLLEHLGYRQRKTGKTGGSKATFIHNTYPPISLHRPHPGSILKRYQVENVYTFLTQEGLI